MVSFKSAVVTGLLAFSSFSFAGPVNNGPVQISSAEFSAKLMQAYASEGTQADGSVSMPRLFECRSVHGVAECQLLAKQWTVSEGPGNVAGKMFVPVTEDAVFDATEYMMVQPKIEEDADVKTSTKSLEVQSDGKYYALICTKASSKNGPDILNQCVLYNGIAQ